ncbi:hypothetical protein TGPRC2_427950, partial [Toxoplasma gondii TgCatPRC2]
ERSEFTRFGIRRLWRVAAPHGPAFFPYESRRVPARMVATRVLARGLTPLWHELSTCWVWRRHMARPLYGMRLVESMRVWVRGCWLCVVVQSLCEIVGRFVQVLDVREEENPGACSVLWCNCRTT